MLESKDSLLAYTDKRDLNLSKSKQLEEAFKKTQAAGVQGSADVWAKVAVWVVIMGALSVVERGRPSGIDASIKILLVLLIEAVLQVILKKGKKQDASVIDLAPKEAFQVKSVTWIMATPDEVLSNMTDPSLRPLWD